MLLQTESKSDNPEADPAYRVFSVYIPDPLLARQLPEQGQSDI